MNRDEVSRSYQEIRDCILICLELLDEIEAPGTPSLLRMLLQQCLSLVKVRAMMHHHPPPPPVEPTQDFPF